MLKQNSNLFFLVIFLSLFFSTHSMDFDFGEPWNDTIPLEYPPLTQPDDYILTLTKNICKTSKSVLTLFPNNKLIETAPQGTRPGVCYHVAMREVLGLTEKQFQQIEKSIVGLQDWVTIIGMPHHFFDQKKSPETGNLAVYTFQKNNFVSHFGIVTSTDRIKSKITHSKYTVEHGYWDLPHWGNLLSFWQLKPIYNNKKGKTKLFLEIITIIKNSKRMEALLKSAQATLFAFACNKSIRTPFSDSTPSRLIKRVVGLNIDLANSNQETALMLASRHGNVKVINTLIKYGADSHLKNKYGKTALDLAEQNKQQIVVNHLKPYPKPVITYYALTTLFIAMVYFYNVII